MPATPWLPRRFSPLPTRLNRGAHIRVSIVLNAVGKGRRFLEMWCFAIATALAWYFVYYAIKTVYWSWKFHDVSQGQDATPIWIPQMSMAIGAVPSSPSPSPIT